MQIILTQEEYDALLESKKKHATDGMEVFLKALGDALKWRTDSDWGIAPARSYVTIDEFGRALTKARVAFDVWVRKP